METYLFYPSTNSEVNEGLLSLLDRLNSDKTEVIVVSEGIILEGKVILPFFQTPLGERYFGQRRILEYIERFY